MIRAFGPRENLRSAFRYALRAEVVFSWIAQDGTEQEAHGYTRDISPGGAYISSTLLPPLDGAVQMSIHLPMFPDETQTPSVQVQGRVLRVEKGSTEAKTGFAVRNERVRLCAR